MVYYLYQAARALPSFLAEVRAPPRAGIPKEKNLQAEVRALVQCSTPCARLLGRDIDGLDEAQLVKGRAPFLFRYF